MQMMCRAPLCTTMYHGGRDYCERHTPPSLTQSRQVYAASKIAAKLNDVRVQLLAIEAEARRVGLVCDAELIGGNAAVIGSLGAVLEGRARQAYIAARQGKL